MDVQMIRTKRGCMVYVKLDQKAGADSPRQASYLWNTIWLVSHLKQLDFSYQ